MVEPPPENYSFIPPDVQLPGTKWLDNHRQVFTVTIDAVTSVHTLNAYLDRFISLCDCLENKKIPPRIGETNIEREVKKSLLEIHLSDLEPLTKNVVVIMDKLIEMLTTTVQIGGKTLDLGHTVFEAMCLVANKLAVREPRCMASEILNSHQNMYFSFIHRRPTKTSASNNPVDRTC